jgi:hypothetical protein
MGAGPLVAAGGMLLWQFSQYLLLALWTFYALLSPLSKLTSYFRRRSA